jgi:hypothetical protein
VPHLKLISRYSSASSQIYYLIRLKLGAAHGLLIIGHGGVGITSGVSRLKLESCGKLYLLYIEWFTKSPLPFFFWFSSVNVVRARGRGFLIY